MQPKNRAISGDDVSKAIELVADRVGDSDLVEQRLDEVVEYFVNNVFEVTVFTTLNNEPTEKSSCRVTELTHLSVHSLVCYSFYDTLTAEVSDRLITVGLMLF